MPVFNVFLGAVGDTGLDDAARSSVQATLLGWYNQIATGTSYTASVSWVTTVPSSVQNHDLLCYFVRSEMDGVLRALPGRREPLNGVNGNTAWSEGVTASEVYVGRSRGFVAELTFHELMHNKLHVGNALHSRNGLAVAEVTNGMMPSAQNITQMRAGLGNNHPQWTGGWQAANDPLAGL